MTYLSIIEKFRILLSSLLDFEFILIFTILLLFLSFVYFLNKISGKKYILLVLLSFIVVFGISIINNYKIFEDTFANFTTILFENIYFPSIYVYIGVLVISFISFVVALLNPMLKKIYKIINGAMFIVNNILFVIILNLIAKNRIDIFSIQSLYTNTSLVALLELSMGLFILWFITLVIVYITNVICDKITIKKIYNEKEVTVPFNPLIEVEFNSVNDVNSSNDISEPSYSAISENELSLMLEDISTKENLIEVCENNTNEEPEILLEESVIGDEENGSKSNVTFNDILNGCLPVTYYDNSAVIENYDLVDPQLIYEENYNKIKNDIAFNDLNIMLESKENVINIEKEEKNSTNKDNIILNDCNMQNEFSVEEYTLKEKIKASSERLLVNTISLNDLIDEEVTNDIETNNLNNKIDILENEEKDGYTVDDYKKFAVMLNSLKNYSNETNIKIDDAVALSLISNYSVDDCLKFKNILENNLN